MVARGRSDHTALLLFCWEKDESVACAAFLETAGPLHLVELAKNLHPGDFTQPDGWRTRRVINRALDSATGCVDVLKCHHDRAIYAAIDSGNVFGRSRSGQRLRVKKLWRCAYWTGQSLAHC